MSSIQYTLRNIPEPVDKALRQRASKEGKSFNKTAVEALENSTLKQRTVLEELDWFIGKSNIDQKEFDEAMAWLDSLPNDLDDNFRV